MRWVLPGVAGATFMLCFASFAVVLTLGGGPWATTIDVAIYQALRLEFDIARAVTLAGVQLTACLLLSAVPQDQVLWRAAGRSASVALLAGALSLALGLSLLHGARVLRAQHGRVGLAGAMELLGLLPLITLPLMLATGLFMLLRPYVDVLAVGLYLTIAVNALMGLPFVLRIVAPAMRRADRETSRLCLDLGIRGWDRFRLVDWPLTRGAAGLALAIAATLAAGDMGVIALFGSQDTETLPLLLYRRMGAYQMDAAAVTATMLAVLCLGLFWALETVVRGRGRGRGR